MQYTTLSNNPFGVLTSVVAPAILTNACSVLALGTGNRLARVVDRTRVGAKEMAAFEPGTSHYEEHFAQLDRLQVRAQFLLRALRAFYASIGLFAAAALVSVVGSIVSYYARHLLFQMAAGLALFVGCLAVLSLASGCVHMVRETRFAVRNLAEEANIRSKRR